ncbi:MAG: thiamine phosphate synthase [Candidatus Omnitrophota bacterium]|nr:thiamine phosphate synthase [Candidatus Omnitrophota bacterium]
MISKTKKEKLAFPLYCITAEEYSLGRGNLAVAKEILAAGVKILQYREKEKSKREKFAECLAIGKMAAEAGAAFIVNDDIDIALAVEADGVHLGQDDLPIAAARRLVGEEIIIGLSTHSQQQAEEAVSKGTDYISIGPIYPTQTKKNACPAVGLAYLDYAVKNISIPFVAIGGIKLYNLREVLAHGARCVAMVTEIVGAKDIRARIKAILSQIPSQL